MTSSGQDASSNTVFGDTRSAIELVSEPKKRPTPHGSKLRELLTNEKLPKEDYGKVEEAIKAYDKWIADMAALTTKGQEKVVDLVRLLNEYKRKIEVNLIWDSESSFIYRQKGQLKLDNSILEEWFPWLVDVDILPELGENDLVSGPAKAFAAASFQSVLAGDNRKPKLFIRSKDQDFTIGRPTYLKASFTRSFANEETDTEPTYLAYIAAEIKTNLDKTMFQEASATSHDLKMAVPGSHYFLICEYLDMTQINSAGTDISEVLILRGKRIESSVRKSYSNQLYRHDPTNRDNYIHFLEQNPIRVNVVERLVSKIRAILQNQANDISNAVERGYF